MRHTTYRRARVVLAAACAVVGGCAMPAGRVAPDSPLGRARELLAEGRHAEARDAFRALLAVTPDDSRARLGLGAALEGLGQPDSARVVYGAILNGTPPRDVRRRLEERLVLLARRELQSAARTAAAEEARLSREPPTPGTVAVLPFRYLGADTSFAPLARALADVVVTDLSVVGSLTLFEREAVQFLLDEIGLSAAGLVDSTTAARPGRLLRAEHVVQGAFDVPRAERVQLSGSAVRTATTEVVAVASGTDQLQSLFDVEKAVVLDLLGRMGITVTPLERERIQERPTQNLLAFLAYGRGLEAEDRGEFGVAVASFRQAVQIDPAFQAAGAHAAAAEAMAAASGTALARVAGLLDEDLSDLAFLTDNLNYVMGSGLRTGERVDDPLQEGPHGDRDGIGDVGGEDRFGGSGGISIIVRRP